MFSTGTTACGMLWVTSKWQRLGSSGTDAVICATACQGRDNSELALKLGIMAKDAVRVEGQPPR